MSPPARLKTNFCANTDLDPDGWCYHVLASGAGREWVVESLRRRQSGDRIVEQRFFHHECDSAFAAGRTFERDLQMFRDFVIEKRRGNWP